MDKIKIIDQMIFAPYTVLTFESFPDIRFNYVVIDGIRYKAYIAFDTPNSIAIKEVGDFVGKEIGFELL